MQKEKGDGFSFTEPHGKKVHHNLFIFYYFTFLCSNCCHTCEYPFVYPYIRTHTCKHSSIPAGTSNSYHYTVTEHLLVHEMWVSAYYSFHSFKKHRSSDSFLCYFFPLTFFFIFPSMHGNNFFFFFVIFI